MLYKWVSIAILAVAAIAGNYFSFNVFANIDFVFGSIAALIALRLFGIGAGCLVAFAGATVTYFDWGHPYAVIIFTLEIAFVGLLVRRVDNIVLTDAMYWLALGGGGVMLYTFFLGVPAGSAAYIALKQALNGVLNAVIAAFLMEMGRVYVPAVRRLLPPVSFRTLLFYLVAFVVMSASAAFVLAQTRSAHDRAVKGMTTAMSLVASWTDREFEENGGDVDQLRRDFEERVSLVLSRLDGRNFPLSGISIGIVYADGEVSVITGDLRSTSGEGQIVTSELGVDQWIPTEGLPDILRARESAYVMRTASQIVPSEREIVIEISAAPLLDLLEAGGQRTLILLALILTVVLFISRLLTHGLTSTTNRFVQMSDGLVEDIMQGRPMPKFQNSGIRDLDAVGAIVRKMSLKLAQSFRDQQELYQSLEARVADRTAELRLLSQIAEQTTNGIIVTDTTGRTTWINKAFTDVTGYTLEDMRGKKPGSVLQKEHIPDVIHENMQISIANRKPFHVEIVNHSKDGNPYWIEIRCNPLFDDEGQHTGFIAIENDVTDRRKTTEALASSLDSLKRATDVAQMGIWEYDTATQKVEWNEHNGWLHGISVDVENKYQAWERAVHPDDLESMFALFVKATPEDEEDVSIDYRYEHPELGERIISTRTRVESIREDGTRVYTGVNLDLTDVRKANLRLEMAGAKTAAILENALDSIITIDDGGHITSFNYAAEAMFGYRAEDIIGKNLSILMPSEHSERHSAYIAAYLKGRAARMIGNVTVVEALRSNGEVFPVELAVSKTIEDSGVVFIGIVRDLTERRRVERMKSEFLAMVSHELRTPLTSIQGTLSLLNAGVFGELPQKGRKLIGSALDNAEMLGGMVDEILDLEKLSSGKLEVHLEPVSAKQLVKRSVDSMRSYVDKFEVQLEKPEDVPDVMLHVDPQRAVQVLNNFISNAVKFSPSGGAVRVKARLNKGNMRISVTDNGHGIPKDKHSLLFQKFSQIDASDSRKNRGTGLGLAISRELMESMGGNIGFDSAEGEGSTFWAEFRISALDTDTAAG